ncbi:dNA segregation ATPase FtsK/SpoIIIE family [Clostridium sp. CAG:440]|nr:dNA segregation ATPase FtsK/SpoIIIE family [Clostridium sp. CAG:440]
MAKKRKYTKSNSRGNTRKSKRMSNIDLTICILIVLSILLGFLIYTNSGVIGVKLNEILGGMMGVTRLLLPIGILGVAIKLACTDNEYVSSKLIKFCVLLISISVIMCVIQISSGELIPSKEISESLKDAYYNGSQGKGGGALGALLAIPMAKLIGNIGTIIVCMGIAIILAATTFGVNVSELINMIVEKHQEKQENKKEEKLHEKESRMQERENRELERAKAKQEARLKKQKQENNPDEQIQINFGGHIIEEESPKKLKKFKHDKDDLIPLGMEKTKKTEPDVIENNLFKQEEEQKQDKTKEVLQLEHTITVEDENYEYPPVELLSKGSQKGIKGGAKALTDTATKLQKTLYSFGVSAKVENVSVGPAITRYELKPAEGVRVSKIANLADDIALNLAAETIRIEAPIPGKQAVGIEVPNKEKQAVHLREVLESEEFENSESKLTIALGKDVAGNTQLADIAKMPHVLIAGSTGSGKSVCINTIITSIIYKAKPSEVKLVMVDPKVVELSVYNGIPHLLIPVVTDPKKAAGALAWAVQEMDNRYNLFAKKGVRDLKGYNKAVKKDEGVGMLPQIVIIVDELADLMMVAAKDVEESICRLAQKARAAGMHLVIATQRPSVDVITGLIKANVPSRIAFAVSSQVDSRTILDSVGAEKLLGKGDMLYFPAGAPKPARVQGAFVSDEEVEKIVDFIKQNGTATYSEDILETIENSNKTDKEIAMEKDEDDDTDPFLMDAIETVVETGQASTSFIQRKFKVGYARAGRIIDQMEERGVISGYQGSKPREVLMTLEKLNELKMSTQTEK